MRESDIKGLGTKDMKALKDPKYPQNKTYRTAYVEGLVKHEETINERIQELDVIIATGKKTAKTKKNVELRIKN